jgi:hypothetical protein
MRGPLRLLLLFALLLVGACSFLILDGLFTDDGCWSPEDGNGFVCN